LFKPRSSEVAIGENVLRSHKFRIGALLIVGKQIIFGPGKVPSGSSKKEQGVNYSISLAGEANRGVDKGNRGRLRGTEVIHVGS